MLNAYEERLRERTQSLKESEEQKWIAENLVAQLTNQVKVLHVQDQATKQTLQSLRQQTKDSLHTIRTKNECLAELHSRAESDLGRKDQEIRRLQEQIKQMNLEQNKMKIELIEAVDIIAEREEALGQEPMEDI